MLKNSLDKAILNTKNQEFIEKNINLDAASLVLNQSLKPEIDLKLLIEQIEAKKRCERKLPNWFNTEKIYYPNKLNIEQTSSETTARYKANIISGQTLIDLTGGFGVDCFYFSKKFKEVTHCEVNLKLSNIVKHNYQQLNVNNIQCISHDGIETLQLENKAYSWIYIDPSRRDNNKSKVFLLADCLPNVPKYLDLLLKSSKNIMIKTSPLLDISSGIRELSNVKQIHVVAVNNEVKELLWILERDFSGSVEIKTVNIVKNENQSLNFYRNEEVDAEAEFSKPLSYLYEPNAAILKAGAFQVLAKKLKVFKLHKHSHLYTSNDEIEFPGRRFKIVKTSSFNKKQIKKLYKNKKANITTRNFPESVKTIRSTFNIKDGGEIYLFFTTNSVNEKIVIEAKKA